MFSARFTVKGDIGTGNVTVKPREAEKDGDKVLHLATFISPEARPGSDC